MFLMDHYVFIPLLCGFNGFNIVFIFGWFKRYFEIDQHLAQHFVFTVSAFQISLPFYSAKWLPLYLNSLISTNHETFCCIENVEVDERNSNELQVVVDKIHQEIQGKNCLGKLMYFDDVCNVYKKALIRTFQSAFLLQNNLCEFTTQEHKFKRWSCT